MLTPKGSMLPSKVIRLLNLSSMASCQIIMEKELPKESLISFLTNIRRFHMREWEPNLQAVNQEDQNSQDQGQGMRKMLLC